MRVLIVEDDFLLGEALATGLRQAGHAVDWFQLGAQADGAIAGAAYDVALLDLGLPGADGMAWLAQWRSRGVEVPIMILTARDAVEQRIAGLDAGADDYLVKPVGVDELAARLRALLRRTAGRSQPVWQHGALTYDPSSKRVQWQGRTVDLTARELALLEALMTDPDRILSKAALLEKLYDWNGNEPESNALEVHVYHLRRKIHPGVVRTVRGVGYSLGAAEPA
ncbi:response regulator transcription factor [Aquincola sp. MAHUQ-54]|uniref:Response regulator transcription factor n=1 Tax=Aquincola agrisoli TaxID=3119538 RepID=A0AAW9PYM7_9BURK